MEQQPLSAADVKAVVGGNGYGYPIMPMYPMMGGFGGGFGNGGFGFGGDFLAILLLFALFGGGWGGGFGGFGGGLAGAGFGLADGGLLGYAIGNNATKGDLSAGLTNVQNGSKLDNLSTQIGTGFANTSTQLCNGFADVQSAICNGINTVNTGLLTGFGNTNLNACQNTNAITNAISDSKFAALQSANAIQSQLAQNAFNAEKCCCENRAGLADLKYTVATENCADRAALEMGVRDIITNQTANTQKILDTLCQDKIDSKNETIAQLRQELLYSRGQASQIAQTAELRAGQNAEVDALYNRLASCPVPTTPVYGRTPIFTCNNGLNNGCGCNGGQFIQ